MDRLSASRVSASTSSSSCCPLALALLGPAAPPAAAALPAGALGPAWPRARCSIICCAMAAICSCDSAGAAAAWPGAAAPAPAAWLAAGGRGSPAMAASNSGDAAGAGCCLGGACRAQHSHSVSPWQPQEMLTMQANPLTHHAPHLRRRRGSHALLRGLQELPQARQVPAHVLRDQHLQQACKHACSAPACCAQEIQYDMHHSTNTTTAVRGRGCASVPHRHWAQWRRGSRWRAARRGRRSASPAPHGRPRRPCAGSGTCALLACPPGCPRSSAACCAAQNATTAFQPHISSNTSFSKDAPLTLEG